MIPDSALELCACGARAHDTLDEHLYLLVFTNTFTTYTNFTVSHQGNKFCESEKVS